MLTEPSVDAVLDQDSVVGPVPESISFILPTLTLTQIHFYIYQVESVSQFQLVLEPTCKVSKCCLHGNSRFFVAIRANQTSR